jgi:phosphoglycerate dehydrogenase-like enzyme
MKIGVCSRSFSRNDRLRSFLQEKYSNVKFNESGKQLEGDDLIDFLVDRDAAIIGLEKINLGILKNLPKLKIISKYGVGLDMIDQKAMALEGRSLGWTPGVNKLAVAELALSFALSLIRRTMVGNRSLIRGEWVQCIGGQLSGKTFGVIGCGNIGKELIRLLTPFNCKIIAFDRIEYSDFNAKFNVTKADLKFLLNESDIISVHLPLNSSTLKLLGDDEFNEMKNNAMIINTARGGIVSEESLLKFMRSGKVAGAAFDVFEIEPATKTPLLQLDNFIATPHIGGSSEEAIYEMGLAAIRGLESNAVPTLNISVS